MALSAIDGRYARTAKRLADSMSEFALIKNRLVMQCRYLIALVRAGIAPLETPNTHKKFASQAEFEDYVMLRADIIEADAETIKTIETKGWGEIKATNHDVVAATTWLTERLHGTVLQRLIPWIHYGRTSEDCNNVAYALMLRYGVRILAEEIIDVIDKLTDFAEEYADIPMLARTHGQAATPTTLGKEFRVFVERLERQLGQLREFKLMVKFNGASGNHNALVAAHAHVDWNQFGREFVESLNDGEPLVVFVYNPVTTQIEPHDTYAELFGIFMRINTILVDFCQDVWRYISDDYLVQRAVKGEVGSSAMPHKVNPIDFENAEGNLLFANAMLEFFARKLPISRLQRDLTDSTVERNFGLAFGHCLHGYSSLLKGLGKISANEKRIRGDLAAHPEVLAEAVQTILRREGIPDAYNKLKDITRGQQITREHLQEFIASLDVSDAVRAELSALTPEMYIGLAAKLAKQ